VFPNQGKVPSTEQRMAGFAMAAAKDHVSVVYGPELDQSIGRGKVVRTWLYTEQPQFDAIFTPNESTTSAVCWPCGNCSWRALSLCRGGPQPLILEAIRSGELLASMVQNTEKMAKIAVQMADDAIHHPSCSGRHPAAPFVLNREVLRNAR
jgi:ABC-type sugar transport system substrate-binding protein